MRASITRNGCLDVIPENELESYALRMWSKHFRTETSGEGGESTLKIFTDVPERPEQTLNLDMNFEGITK